MTGSAPSSIVVSIRLLLGLLLALAVGCAGKTVQYKEDHDRILRIDPNGILTTLAGTGTAGFSGDGGPANAARLQFPAGAAVDAAGNVYIADSWNHRIRRVDTSGIITTIAGTGVLGNDGDGGLALDAALTFPVALAFDPAGDLHITSKGFVRKIDVHGVITTVAGAGKGGWAGDGGPAVQARLFAPEGLAVAPDGTIFVADVRNNRVRRVAPPG